MWMRNGGCIKVELQIETERYGTQMWCKAKNLIRMKGKVGSMNYWNELFFHYKALMRVFLKSRLGDEGLLFKEDL